eukprot:c16173_g1_i1 orf=219-1355(+)
MDSSIICKGYKNEGRKDAPNNKERHSFWNNAPDELIARIISLLPCSSIYLSRGVCRRWRSIVWSPLFMSLCKQWSRPRKPWLLEFQQQMYNQAWAFDLDGQQWFHLNFFFLPENAIILASSRGLVCLGRMSTEGYTLYVCNPVTRIWRQLPPLPVNPGVVLLDVDHKSSTYKVAALVLRGGPCISRPSGAVFVFDSKIGGFWLETVGVPQKLSLDKLWDASFCSGFLCCVSSCQSIEVFDVANKEWTPRAVFTHPPVTTSDADLSSDGPYMFDLAGTLGAIFPHRGRIFRFDVAARCWRPANPANGFVCAGRFSSLFSRTSQDGWVVNLLQAKGHKCFNSFLRSCSLLPKSPLTRHKIRGREILIRGFWFEPHIGATP